MHVARIYFVFSFSLLCQGEDKQGSFVSAFFNFRPITQMVMYACKEFICCWVPVPCRWWLGHHFGPFKDIKNVLFNIFHWKKKKKRGKGIPSPVWTSRDRLLISSFEVTDLHTKKLWSRIRPELLIIPLVPSQLAPLPLLYLLECNTSCTQIHSLYLSVLR